MPASLATLKVRTATLEIVAEIGGPENGSPVFLLHGWPDSPRTWLKVAPALNAAGYRTVAPYLRGSAPTTFLSAETPRVGSGVALAQDVIDLADYLGWKRFGLVGHDWGARTAYTLAALFPERVTRIAALALAYQPKGAFEVPPFSQARRFWYQWFMTLNQGAEAVRNNPVGFARIQWDTWSPSGWFDDDEFAATAASFVNPDWAEIALNAYRSRWRSEPSDPRYENLQRRLSEVETLATPTLMLQGSSDFCDEPASSEGRERFFTGGYKRLMIDRAGHFLPREAPGAVAKAVLSHLRPESLSTAR